MAVDSRVGTQKAHTYTAQPAFCFKPFLPSSLFYGQLLDGLSKLCAHFIALFLLALKCAYKFVIKLLMRCHCGIYAVRWHMRRMSNIGPADFS